MVLLVGCFMLFDFYKYILISSPHGTTLNTCLGKRRPHQLEDTVFLGVDINLTSKSVSH